MIELRSFHGSAIAEQEALLSRLESPFTQPELWVWHYDQASIILGCSQRRQQQGWRAMAAKQNSAADIVVRRAGGGVVLAGPSLLSVSLLFPVGINKSLDQLTSAFEWFGEHWREALARQAIRSRLADPDDFTHFSKAAANCVDWACFAGLSHGELLDSAGRKLLGLAQIRKQKSAALVSGLILQRQSWESLVELYPGFTCANTEKYEAIDKLDELVASSSLPINTEQLLQDLLKILNTKIVL
jgi:lipoate---protein ligase